MAFGRALRPLWNLAPDATFLNHGSFGACPKAVLAEQERLRCEMESQPDRFFREGVMPREGGTPLRDAIARLASFAGTQPDRIALLENATAGVAAVVRSMPFAAGDEILVTDHTYNAVRLIVEARCAETGARPRVVTLPLAATAGGIVERFRDALTFFESLGPQRAREYRAALIARATSRMAALGLRPAGGDDLACAMRSFVLPQRGPATQADADAWVARLRERHRIQAMAVVFGEALLLRLSAQVYVGDEDIDALAGALERDGWPGR